MILYQRKRMYISYIVWDVQIFQKKKCNLLYFALYLHHYDKVHKFTDVASEICKIYEETYALTSPVY